jgi:hypothetical protein
MVAVNADNIRRVWEGIAYPEILPRNVDIRFIMVLD